MQSAEVKKPLNYQTNGGRNSSTVQGTFKGVGRVWYDRKALMNIFAFATLKKKFRVTYDSSKEDAFLVHMPNNIVKFRPDKNGLYTTVATQSYLKAIEPLK